MKKNIAILLSLFIIGTYPVMAIKEVNSTKIEHIVLPKKLAKKAPTNIVNSYPNKIEILPYNTLQVAFAESFDSKYAKIGDKVVFILTEALKTQEETEILPESTTLVAEISNIENPKLFNKNGKIYLDFKYIEFPNGTKKAIKARLFNNDSLSRGKLNALGKGLGTTLGGMAAGTGAGCGIGAAASSVVLGGLAIGLPVGLLAGASYGLYAPGLYYKAKAGDKVNIQLLNNLIIEKKK